MIKFPLLTSEDIECKPKQITKAGALLLLYKTSRTDARILDETVGVMNWTDNYSEIKGNLYCSIGIREKEDQDFVFKTDCGVESDQKDDDRKKAECSDAFKRCASKLGIGRELYTSPQIWAKVATKEDKNGNWVLEDPYAKYVVTKIGYNEKTRVITELQISNAKTSTVVYDWKMSTNEAMTKKMSKTLQTKTAVENAEVKQEKKIDIAEQKPVEPTKVENKMSLKSLVSSIGTIVKNMMKNNGTTVDYNNIVQEVTGGTAFKCNKATEEDYDKVLAIYNKLLEKGYKI